jgi:hypothetical protein
MKQLCLCLFVEIYLHTLWPQETIKRGGSVSYKSFGSSVLSHKNQNPLTASDHQPTLLLTVYINSLHTYTQIYLYGSRNTNAKQN